MRAYAAPRMNAEVLAARFARSRSGKLRFHLSAPGSRAPVVFKQHFNPFVYKLDVTIPQGCTLDRRSIFGLAVLICAIEGRQG